MKNFIGLIFEMIASMLGIIKHSYYASSALAKAQAKLIAAFESSELRYTDPAVYRLFLQQAPIMFPGYEMLKTRDDRVVEAYYKKRTSRSLDSGRSHEHTGAYGDSGVLTPSWTTYSDQFAISIKQADNNVYSLEEMQMNELQNTFTNFIEGLETVATTYLITNRSHVNAAPFVNANDDLGVFNGSTYVHEIPAATLAGLNNFNAMFANSISTVMNVNKYKGFSIVCDSVAWAKMQYVANQGAANSNNLSFTTNGITFYHAIKLNTLAVALGYTQGFALAISDGTIGCLPWIPKQNRQGLSTKIQNYGSLINPFDGQLYAIHDYPTAFDGTATGGYTQDENEEFELSIDLAFNHAPLSASGETPIFAFGISGEIS